MAQLIPWLALAGGVGEAVVVPPQELLAETPEMVRNVRLFARTVA